MNDKMKISMLLAEVGALRARLEGHDGSSCMVCGCTQNDPCEEGCGWAEVPDWMSEGVWDELLLGECLCTACAAALDGPKNRFQTVMQRRASVFGQELPEMTEPLALTAEVYASAETVDRLSRLGFPTASAVLRLLSKKFAKSADDVEKEGDVDFTAGNRAFTLNYSAKVE